MEKNMKIRVLLMVFFTVITAAIGIGNVCDKSSAATKTTDGKLYYFDEDNEYDISSSSDFNSIIGNTVFGSFDIKGDVRSNGRMNGVPSYEIGSGAVSFSYSLNGAYSGAGEYSWHAYEDKDDEVDGIKFADDILSGAVIVQTSLTGDNWITDAVYSDVRNAEKVFKENIYETRKLQQLNGCYYRIIVAYKEQKRVEDSKLLFIPITNYEYRRVAEVYCFYLRDSSENAAGKVSPATTPMMNLTNMDSKINTGRNNGFSGTEAITRDDPHYGWEMGTFFVNGYTDSTTENEVPVFLKNVGDQVTLWFNLKQDIDRLNGNKNLKVNENKGGSDQQFEIGRTDFRRGTLIIRYTNYRNETQEPIIYTNYLASCTRTGADTMVELFEEGDYEVALDYELVDEEGIDTYTDYRVYFRFKIRNSNCMAYPFDSVSGTELSDGAITGNGFRLDLARSRYLTINVERRSVTFKDGRYVEDSRFNGAAKDGDTYAEEGIYIFTVTNRYTASKPGTKRIYVGSSPILKAMAGSGMTLSEINSCIEEGAEILEDGSIYLPETEPIQTEQSDAERKETILSQLSVSLLSGGENSNNSLVRTATNTKAAKKIMTRADNESSSDDGEIRNQKVKEYLELFKNIAIVIGIPMILILEMKRSWKQKKQKAGSGICNEKGV